MVILYVKTAIALCALTGSLFACSKTKIRLAQESYILTVLISMFGRLFILWILHGVFDFKYPSDIPGYFDQANDILHGLIPNRDFHTPYSFLFPYVLALGIYIWHTPLAILFTFTIAEHVGLFLISQSIKLDYGTKVASQFALLYAINPLIVISFLLSGQDEAMLIFGMGICIGAASLRNPVLRSLIYIFAGLISKLFAIWFIIPVFVKETRSAQVVMALAGAVLLFIFKYFGISLLSFDFDRKDGSSDHLLNIVTSGNIYYILRSVLDINKILHYFILAGGLGLTLVTLVSLRKTKVFRSYILLSAAALALAYQIGAQMTFSYYLVVAVPGLLQTVTPDFNRSKAVPILIWSVVAALDTQLFYSVKDAGLAFTASLVCSGLVVVLNIVMLLACLRWLASDRKGVESDDALCCR